MKCSCGNEMQEKENVYGKYSECEKCDIRAYGDGTPADKELRGLRMEAHKLFDQWWKAKEIKRWKAYKQLAQDIGVKKDKAHMRYFDKKQCNLVIKIYTKRIKVVE